MYVYIFPIIDFLNFVSNHLLCVYFRRKLFPMPLSRKDKDMLTGLKVGNKGVIDQIYEAYQYRLFAFAMSFLKNDEDAKDIVHDVFVKLWKKRHEFDENTEIEALVFTVARNTVLSLFRKRASENKYFDHIINENNNLKPGLITEEQVDCVLLEERINHLVELLPIKRRSVYVLSRQNGLSNKEISQKLGIAGKTVEDHITKALAFLRKHLKNDGVLGLIF